MYSVWRRGHPLWLAPHRPFFLLAGLWAALVPAVWLLPEGLGPEPLSWHRHELLFGMGGAAVGGYLLTALPAWTGGVAVTPAVTRLLVMLWLAGRLAFAVGLPPLPAAVAGACYFVVLAGLLVQAVSGAKAWRRLPLAAAPFLAGAFVLLSAPGIDVIDEQGAMRALALLYGLLISLVGGRAVPAFTRHWAERSCAGIRFADPPWMSGGAILALLAAILLVAVDATAPAGSLLILSGATQLSRMLPWRSWTTWRYPPLLLLHLAWLWLPLGLVATGMTLLPSTRLDTASGVHALTMGAMGTMMLAMMARAAMVRREAMLQLSRETALAFALVFLSAPARLCMAFAGDDGRFLLLQLSVILWSGGWALFLWDFRRALQGPVPRPVLSARTQVAASE